MIKWSRESPHSGWFAGQRMGLLPWDLGVPDLGGKSDVARVPHTQSRVKGDRETGWKHWVLGLRGPSPYL